MFSLYFSSEAYYLLSRLVAFAHLLYVLFVSLGLFAIYLGLIFKWRFIRNPYFRIIHLVAMIIVAIQQYFLINCPLTVLEKRLLILAGRPTYSGAFIPNLLNQFSFNIPGTYYLPLYVSLGLLFILSFVFIPPIFKHR